LKLYKAKPFLQFRFVLRNSTTEHWTGGKNWLFMLVICYFCGLKIAFKPPGNSRFTCSWKSNVVTIKDVKFKCQTMIMV